ncbi:MAG: hypothetical protein CMP59_04205 [Flavobacteriales bacterium]|nr:hypothetical protein [Flavobacteriales bacterium]
MFLRLLLIFICLNTVKIAPGQDVILIPEVLMGNRSQTYLQYIGYDFNKRLSVNNLTLFDTEYSDDSNNIHFVRNTISYEVSTNVLFNTSIGVKNPGHFATIALQYRYSKKDLQFSYSAGTTYQEGFTLEQSLLLKYTPSISNNLKAYFNLLAIANIDLKEYQRGIQQLRLGMLKHQTAYGLGLNLDQFNNASKTLSNLGVFIKHNF